ncbi:hypothetical protein OEZ86_007952 [Tetradesmus obliquus]|nr:hypothetical protein OEZ86_007952 [Tetradesmus obliquus]
MFSTNVVLSPWDCQRLAATVCPSGNLDETLQAAAAALPVHTPTWSPELDRKQQETCKWWAEQATPAALAALRDTVQEHRQAYERLCDEVRGAASDLSIAAHAAANQQQLQQQQQQADAVAATGRLAAASAEVTRLQQLLQLAGSPVKR